METVLPVSYRKGRSTTRLVQSQLKPLVFTLSSPGFPTLIAESLCLANTLCKMIFGTILNRKRTTIDAATIFVWRFFLIGEEFEQNYEIATKYHLISRCCWFFIKIFKRLTRFYKQIAVDTQSFTGDVGEFDFQSARFISLKKPWP